MKHFVSLAGLAAIFLTGCESSPVAEIDSKLFPPEKSMSDFSLADETKPEYKNYAGAIPARLEWALSAKLSESDKSRDHAKVRVAYSCSVISRKYYTGSAILDDFVSPVPDTSQNPAFCPAPTRHLMHDIGSDLVYSDIRITLRGDDISVQPTRTLWTTTITVEDAEGEPTRLISAMIDTAAHDLASDTGGPVARKISTATSP